jgi:HEPN domain-containing protein
MRTHSVSRLIDEVFRVIQIPIDLVEKVEKLYGYYIPTRYPNAWPELPPYKHYLKEDAAEALSIEVTMVELIRRKLEEDI